MRLNRRKEGTGRSRRCCGKWRSERRGPTWKRRGAAVELPAAEGARASARRGPKAATRAAPPRAAGPGSRGERAPWARGGAGRREGGDPGRARRKRAGPEPLGRAPGGGQLRQRRPHVGRARARVCVRGGGGGEARGCAGRAPRGPRDAHVTLGEAG